MKEHVIKPKVEKLFKTICCVFTDHREAMEMPLKYLRDLRVTLFIVLSVCPEPADVQYHSSKELSSESYLR